jgi:alanine racemase
VGKSLQARISQIALLHNLQRVREIVPGRSIIAMIKANGYGHGLVSVARILQNADAFGVADLEEALELRQEGIDGRIILMEGFFSSADLNSIYNWQLETVIHHLFQIDVLVKHKANNKIKAWIKVNTGMNRLGLTIEDCIKHFDQLKKYCDVIGLLTHFSDADAIDNPKTKQQIAKFIDLKKRLNGSYPCSLANSAAILAWPEAHADWVRPGIMLYGVSPFKNSCGADFNLRPAMQLVAKIIAINLISKGEAVGYGSRFICPRDMLIGVIRIGYADGYISLIKDGTPVLVNKCHAKVVGRVSMDMVTIDLNDFKDVKIGDEVVLWGEGLPVEEVARNIGIIPYELLTSVGTRVARVYTHEHEEVF